METRASSALIGAAAVAIVFAIFGSVQYRLSGSGRSVRQYQTYQLIVPGSVSGLSRGSAVQFNGLKVGEVVQLDNSEEAPDRVDVLFNIDKTTPVKTDTRARLDRGVLTGVAVVSLTSGATGAADIQVKPGQRHPQILAEKTVIQDLFATLERLAPVPKILEKAGDVIDTIRAAPASAEFNVGKFTDTFAENSRNIENIGRDGTDLGHALKTVSARLARLTAAMDLKTLRNIGGAGASANSDRFSASRLRGYERFAVGARKAVNRFDGAVRSLERDPQRAISGATPAAPEQQGR